MFGKLSIDLIKCLTRLLITSLTIMMLIGCQSGAQVIPFETLIESEEGGNYPETEPTIFLINSAEEIAQVELYLQPERLDAIRNVDFEQHSVLILFRGSKPSSGYRTIIEQIIQSDDEAAVHAQFWNPSPHWGETTALTSPHHIVKISKQSTEPSLKFTIKQKIVTPTPPSN